MRAASSGFGAGASHAIVTTRSAPNASAKRRSITSPSNGAPARSVSVARGVAFPARIGAAAEDAGLAIDGDGLRAARHRRPIGKDLELVAAGRERSADGLRPAPFDLQPPAALVVPAGRVDRLLHVHLEIDEPDRELEIGLHLRVASGRSENETRPRA